MSAAELPLSDWRCTRDHVAEDCNLERCENCGCCVHGKTQAAGCPIDDAPFGAQCSNRNCGCEGQS
jgi:hypothetical protein